MKNVIIQDTGGVSATPARTPAIATNPRYSGLQDCHFGEGDDCCAAQEERKLRPRHRTTGQNTMPDTLPPEGVNKG